MACSRLLSCLDTRDMTVSWYPRPLSRDPVEAAGPRESAEMPEHPPTEDVRVHVVHGLPRVVAGVE